MVGSCLVGPGGPRSTAEARGSDRRVAAAAAFGRRPAPEAAFLSRRRKVSRVIIPDPVAVVGRAEAQRNPRIPKTPAASSASSRAAASVDDASTSEGPAADAPDDEAWTPPPWMVAWYTRKAKLSLDGPRYLRDIGADLRLASRVLALRPRFASLSDRALASVTRELRARLAGGETIREVREDAFAAVREAARRSLGLEPYPVQLAGASALLDGRCVEMGTGEGKSLMALLPAYLLALQGGGCHIVTVNDYLASRDAYAASRCLGLLGVSVGVVAEHDPADVKRKNYERDVVYATAQAIGFDFLRSRNAETPGEVTNPRPLRACIVDEVDSILVDVASAPLILTEYDDLPDADAFRKALPVARALVKKAHFEADEVSRTVRLTDAGTAEAERLAGEPIWESPPKDGEDGEDGRDRTSSGWGEDEGRDGERLLGGYIVLCLQALHCYRREVGRSGDGGTGAGAGPAPAPSSRRSPPLSSRRRPGLCSLYIFSRPLPPQVHYTVVDDRVVLVDQDTGRRQEMTRLQDSMHVALECVEDVPMMPRNRVTASCTYQTLFRYYDHVCGMTGTATDEQTELLAVYGLRVTPVPPNRESRRTDLEECWFPTGYWRNVAVARLVRDAWGLNDPDGGEHVQDRRPFLLGTGSIAQSEALSAALTAVGVDHRVLNARPELAAAEADVVAQAGRPGAVTISTNMAGRGTDILLGGCPQALARVAIGGLLRSLCAEHDDVDVSSAAAATLALATDDDAAASISLYCAAVARGDATDAAGARVARAFLAPLANHKFVSPLEAAELAALDVAVPPPPPARLWASATAVEGEAGVAVESLLYLLRGERISMGRALWRRLGSDAAAIETLLEAADRLKNAALRRAAVARSAFDAGASGAAAADDLVAFHDPQRWGRVWGAGRGPTDVLGELAAGGAVGGGGGLADFGGEWGANEALLAHLARALVGLETLYAVVCRDEGARVRGAGGLCVVSANVEASRRVELQLLGRAGRQGDAGATLRCWALDDPFLAEVGLGMGVVRAAVASAAEPQWAKDPSKPVVDLALSGNVVAAREAWAGELSKRRARYQAEDAVVETFRDGHYATCDAILGGDNAARAYVHACLRLLADAAVDRWCCGPLFPWIARDSARSPRRYARNPARWDVAGLAGEVAACLGPPEGVAELTPRNAAPDVEALERGDVAGAVWAPGARFDAWGDGGWEHRLVFLALAEAKEGPDGAPAAIGACVVSSVPALTPEGLGAAASMATAAGRAARRARRAGDGPAAEAEAAAAGMPRPPGGTWSTRTPRAAREAAAGRAGAVAATRRLPPLPTRIPDRLMAPGSNRAAPASPVFAPRPALRGAHADAAGAMRDWLGDTLIAVCEDRAAVLESSLGAGWDGPPTDLPVQESVDPPSPSPSTAAESARAANALPWARPPARWRATVALRRCALAALRETWQAFLEGSGELREEGQFRAFAQEDPLHEYAMRLAELDTKLRLAGRLSTAWAACQLVAPADGREWGDE